jgi:hypothetical protein
MSKRGEEVLTLKKSRGCFLQPLKEGLTAKRGERNDYGLEGGRNGGLSVTGNLARAKASVNEERRGLHGGYVSPPDTRFYDRLSDRVRLDGQSRVH